MAAGAGAHRSGGVRKLSWRVRQRKKGARAAVLLYRRGQVFRPRQKKSASGKLLLLVGSLVGE